MKEKLNDKLIKPLLGFLKQGITPHKLALAVGLGLVLGLFPVIGVTSILCFIAAAPLRLNMAAIQLINYLVYPVQIICVIPFIKLGSWLLNINPIPYSVSEMVELIGSDFWLAFDKLWRAHLLGIFAWAIIIIPMGIILFFILRVVFKRFARD